jgi:hypothetical protein
LEFVIDEFLEGLCKLCSERESDVLEKLFDSQKDEIFDPIDVNASKNWWETREVRQLRK